METMLQLIEMKESLQQGTALVGGKSYNLACVEKFGFRIPVGFVIPCQELHHEVSEEFINQIYEKAVSMSPGPWAIRSSGVEEDGAENSFAGQFESVLNVSDVKGFKDAIQKCIQSASSAQVKSYGLKTKQSIALLVQQMVNADCAGVAFSANPITGERGEVLINAVEGLADKLVSGAVTPEEYIISKTNPNKSITKGKLLKLEQQKEIFEAVNQLEKCFECPQDIEWAIEKNQLYILQSRPITALPPQPIPIKIEIPEGTWIRNDHHTTASPMLVSLFADRYNQATKNAFENIGFNFKSINSKMIGGHLYDQWLMEGDDQKTPPAWVLWLVSRLMPSMRKMNRIIKNFFDNNLAQKEMELWYSSVKPYFEKRINELSKTELSQLSDDELLLRWHEIHQFTNEGIDAHADRMGSLILPGEFYIFCQDNLSWDTDKFFKVVSGWSEASAHIHHALCGICEKHFAENIPAKTDLEKGISHIFKSHPAFKADIESWITENALRIQDYDLINPTLGEQPEVIFQNVLTILEQIHSGKPLIINENKDRDQAFAEARKKLNNSPLLEQFEELAKWCKIAYSLRDENGLFTVAQPLGLARLQLLEMGKRMKLNKPADIFFIETNELEDAFKGKMTQVKETIEKRIGEKQWAVFNRGPKVNGKPAALMPPSDPFPEPMRKMFRIWAWWEKMELAVTESSDNENSLKGRNASTGKYQGIARLVKSPKDFDKVKAGEVMVCRITSGEWGTVFGRIGALITEEGGMLSHPAIIAREFRIPAVVGIDDAMKKIKDGMQVEVDGNTGIVRILN